jgi:hypothetical protein
MVKIFLYFFLPHTIHGRTIILIHLICFEFNFSANPKINGILAPKPRVATKRSDSVNTINSNQPK